MKKRRGFTLIEILVVIGIIAILAAILFPVLSRARESARTKSCLSNMKQLGLAFQMYTQDYGRRYPQAGSFYNWKSGSWVAGTNDKTIADIATFKPIPDSGSPTGYRMADIQDGALYRYVRSAGVYICPSNEDGDKKGLSYSMNCAIAGASDVRIQEPTAVVLLVDEVQANDGFFYATDSVDGAGESGAIGTSTDALTSVHNGGGNLLFCDGHVKFYPTAVFPLTSNKDPQYGAKSRINKYKKEGSPRFHDRRLGSKGSWIPPGQTGAVKDACMAKIP